MADLDDAWLDGKPGHQSLTTSTPSFLGGKQVFISYFEETTLNDLAFRFFSNVYLQALVPITASSGINEFYGNSMFILEQWPGHFLFFCL